MLKHNPAHSQQAARSELIRRTFNAIPLFVSDNKLRMRYVASTHQDELVTIAVIRL